MFVRLRTEALMPLSYFLLQLKYLHLERGAQDKYVPASRKKQFPAKKRRLFSTRLMTRGDFSMNINFQRLPEE